MRRELPPRPHLQHLKKQAKELLEAYRKGEPAAQQRVVEALPMLSGRSNAEFGSSPLALHDMQSVIAREYGYDSWRDLRAELERRADRRIVEQLIAEHIKRPLPDDVLAALRASWSSADSAAQRRTIELPHSLPVVGIRDTMVCPRMIAPLHFMRPASLAALDAAARMGATTVAAFSQRDPRVENPELGDLYPTGCQIDIRSQHPQPGGVTVIAEGLRWIHLEQLSQADGYLIATVTPVRAELPRDDDDEPLIAAAESVRERASRLARAAMPEPERAVALIESVELPDQLGDLVIGNLVCPLAEKARYAAEPDPVERLHIVQRLLDAQLTQLAAR